MSIDLSSCKGVVTDLEKTLVDLVFVDAKVEGKSHYVAINGSLEFLNRCLYKFGRYQTFILTTAAFETCVKAYVQALNRHQALGIIQALCGVQKPLISHFRIAASCARALLSFPKEEIAYIDDKLDICINALTYGFGTVVCVNLLDNIQDAVEKLNEQQQQIYNEAIETGRLHLACSLSEIVF